MRKTPTVHSQLWHQPSDFNSTGTEAKVSTLMLTYSILTQVSLVVIWETKLFF